MDVHFRTWRKKVQLENTRLAYSGMCENVSKKLEKNHMSTINPSINIAQLTFNMLSYLILVSLIIFYIRQCNYSP